jgi:hypothetical protein
MNTKSNFQNVVFDRRQIYRPFLEQLNPMASLSVLAESDLIVPREHDPRDPTQSPIHVVLADAAELSRGTQMAITGGIGSGKTTELLLTQSVLGRHSDALNIFLDLANDADINEISTGAILATAGIRLFSLLSKQKEKPSDEITVAYRNLYELAFGKTKWVPPEALDLPDYDDGDRLYPVKVPGLIKPRLPSLQREVKKVKELFLSIASPYLHKDAQITLLIDGLDRLIKPERFREFVEQDLHSLRGTKISTIIVAPLLLWYDKSGFFHDYFDMVKHIPAAATSPGDTAFLKKYWSVVVPLA